MKNNIDDLRDHLFETIERLKDEEDPMDLQRAKTIADVSQVIINSAKVEVDLVKHTGGEPCSPLFVKPKALPSGGAEGKQPLRAIEGKNRTA
jgi:hypothetical protein